MNTYFLNNHQIKILKILAVLNKSEDHSCRYRDIAKETGITLKSIPIYIDSLLSYDDVHFSTEDNVLFESSTSDFHHGEILAKMMTESPQFNLLTSILHEDISTMDLYQRLNVADSTLRGYITTLNKLLKDYHIALSFKYPSKISGTEVQIRFFYYILLWRLKTDEKVLNQKLLDDFADLLREMDPLIDRNTIEKLQLSTYITQIRMSNGFFVNEKTLPRVQNHPVIAFDKFFEFLDGIGIFANCPDEETKKIECRYMYLIFCTANLTPLSKIQTLNMESTFLVSPLLKAITFDVERYFGISLTRDEVLYLQVNLYFMHDSCNFLEGKVDFFDVYNWAESFKNNSPKDFDNIEMFLEEIEKEYRELQGLYDKFPSLKYIYRILVSKLLTRHKKTLKVYVSAKISVLQLENFIDYIKQVAIVPIKILSECDLKEETPDCIISDWLPPKKYKELPYFNLSSLYRQWDVTALEKFLLSLVDGKYQ